MIDYKVFIPCAGLGSRLGLKYNKTLTTVGQKPVIAHIIDKFASNVEIVIALGYDGDNVRQVVDFLYPNRKITYVEINPYQGEGSGLGLTLLQCKDHLQSPFIFCPCDTIVTDDIPPPTFNWMGFAHTEDGYPDIEYRSFRKEDINHTITEICSKEVKGPCLYIGLCGISHYDTFWKSMEEGQDVGSIESGEVYGLKHLLKQTIYAHPFHWFDTGSPNSLSDTRKHFPPIVRANILPKDDEAIWFIGNDVIKFSINSSFIVNRVTRAHKFLDGYVPEIFSYSSNLYAYKKQEGEVLSNKLTLNRFNKLLKHLVAFWNPDTSEPMEYFTELCTKFYKDKTYNRVRQYLKMFEQIDQPENINGVDVPSIWTVLDSIDWKWLCTGFPTPRFHGDLHFENILVGNHDNFTFLDWRQDFAGTLERGDLYYDLAKLNHGILISHELIDKNLFNHSVSNNVVTFDFLRKNISVELEQRLKEFIIEWNCDYRKVQYLTYLIFLNIAALHHYPYGLLLFHLGKLGLWQLLEKDLEKDKAV